LRRVAALSAAKQRTLVQQGGNYDVTLMQIATVVFGRDERIDATFKFADNELAIVIIGA
jgi:hypothetical protein